MYYIGVDLGTSSVKLILMEPTGDIVNTVSKTYPISFPKPGWSEQNPTDWYDKTCEGIKELIKDIDKDKVAGISFGGQMHGLVILDEIGRGTSTFDGLSIAWAVVEHIANTKILGAKTLFATHYHELTELEGTLDGVNNYCIAVKECGDDIVFLRKIIKGGADKSYGIQVAKLAGVPENVLNRAKELVVELSDADISQKAKDIAQYSKKVEKMNDRYKKVNELEVKQMTLFDTVKDDDIIKDIKELDISNMTPIDALNILYKLQGKVKNRYFVNEN